MSFAHTNAYCQVYNITPERGLNHFVKLVELLVFTKNTIHYKTTKKIIEEYIEEMNLNKSEEWKNHLIKKLLEHDTNFKLSDDIKLNFRNSLHYYIANI